MIKLFPSVKRYNWGMASYLSIGSGFIETTEDENDIIAEVWWGSHPNGPTRTETGGYLENIPFLLKILSVATPLSIQVHPTKEQIFSSPLDFQDPFPKPEIAIALTRFGALCGFLPPKEISYNLSLFPELSSGLTFKEALATPVETIRSITKRIVEIDEYPFNIVSMLSIHYPDDPAVLSPLFMNYVELDAYQALVIPASVPHCYLFGQAVECMAPSDNVVRGGLTPKYRDLDLFFKISQKEPYTPIILEDDYNHPIFTDYFNITEVYTNDSVKCKENSIVLILNDTGTINGEPTKKGDSWLSTSTGDVRFTNVYAIIAQPT